MRKLTSTVPLAAAGLLAALALAAAAPAAAQDDAAAVEARKARIISNLKATFPQLQGATLAMSELKPSGIEGLDEGTLQINNRPQNFLVTRDDKKFYLVGNPIDVSRSEEEIAAELARQESEKAKEAEKREEELAAAVAGVPFRGAADAPVTIVEFSDFQCPFCARGAATVEQILEKYPGKVKFVFKHFPLGMHPWAKPAAIAAHCAAEQKADAFWTLHDGYFKDQREINPGNVAAKSKEYLANSGIDLAKWATCAEDSSSEAYKAAAAAVDADMALGQKLGVSGTPGFFVNGEFLNGAQPITAFEPIIEKATGG